MADPSLPMPDTDAQAHSARVVSHVRGEIGRSNGFISFARYMELVLYAPSLGYYVAGARKFGTAGDFTTGPELTPLYGAASARQIEAVLRHTSTREVVELGAGSGALAASIIAEMEVREAPLAGYRILEVSPGLRAQQQGTIAKLDRAHVVEWLDRLPSTIEGVVVMNEVLDAIAPRVVARRGGRWFERGVTWAGDALCFDERVLDDARLQAVAEARFPPAGDYVSEINVAAEALVTTIARRVVRGAVLIIDYGFPRREYYHEQRCEGTLVGHYRHRVHADPFLWPGLSDLTAHVDFTAVAEAGERAGMEVAGFASLASFLIGCGILELLQAIGPPESRDYLRAASEVQKLISPAEMGELFKVMLLSRGEPTWPALAVTGMTRRL